MQKKKPQSLYIVIWWANFSCYVFLAFMHPFFLSIPLPCPFHVPAVQSLSNHNKYINYETRYAWILKEKKSPFSNQLLAIEMMRAIECITSQPLLDGMYSNNVTSNKKRETSDVCRQTVEFEFNGKIMPENSTHQIKSWTSRFGTFDESEPGPFE